MTTPPRTADQGLDSQAVLDFWRQAGPGRWFRKDSAFDAEFRQRFEGAHQAVAAAAPDLWLQSPGSALALVILLDQFPRNAYRGSARMFATDALAVQAAERAVQQGFDHQVEPALRPFFYMPFMHSEQLAEQDRCVQLCSGLDGDTLRYAEMHRDIIRRFGRFPHRNALLGRSTSAQEQAFLDAGGFAG